MNSFSLHLGSALDIVQDASEKGDFFFLDHRNPTKKKKHIKGRISLFEIRLFPTSMGRLSRRADEWASGRVQ